MNSPSSLVNHHTKRRRQRIVNSILCVIVAAGAPAALSACGGGGDSSSTTTAASLGADQSKAQTDFGGVETTQKSGDGSKDSNKGGASSRPRLPRDTSASFTPKQYNDSGGGSVQFRMPGGDNSLQDFGSEALPSEFDQAAAALHGYLDARAAGAWQAACSYMASAYTASLRQLAGDSPQLQGKGCPTLLASLSAGMPAYLKHDLVQADVGSLRVKGDNAYLFFHGVHNADFFMPMFKENGEWKVGTVIASKLP